MIEYAIVLVLCSVFWPDKPMLTECGALICGERYADEAIQSSNEPRYPQDSGTNR